MSDDFTRQHSPVSEAATLPSAADRDHAVSVPGYQILEKLGEGGMGVVYRARHLALGRVVALKMILSGAHAGEADLARFRTEAEAIARLAHPNVVQIYEVGECQGRPFLALEYCAGGGLDRKLGGTPLPPREAASLARSLALAVQAAHDKDVVHRDLKPANVLLTEDGTPKITDFGLAKKLDDVGQTATGAVMGTPSYMAPEQAGGKKDVGPPADVYALGAVLYECLTGRPPFKAATPLDTLVQVMDCDPVPVRLLNPRADRDLETICLRCLEKDPRRRYPSAEAVARDLGRQLDGEAISVRSVNVLGRLTRALERSHLDAELAAWGTVLLLWSAAVLAAHLALHLWANRSAESRHLLSFASYGGQFVLMTAAYWACRPVRAAGPASPAEARLWSIWSGYLVACMTLLTHVSLLPGFSEAPLCWATYPSAALLTGLAFFVMGGYFWGWFYAYGVGFFALSVAMSLELTWAPLEFGVAWSAALLTLGLHLRRLGRAGEQTGP